jgi:protein AroM
VTPILGVVTIGQTPRADLAEAFGVEAAHAEVRVAGALDGIHAEDLAALQDRTTSGPDGLEYPLLVRLASGAHIEVPLDRLVPRVTAAAGRLAADGAALIVVACAGGFPDVPSPVPVLLPGRIVPAVAGAISRTRRVGVVTPNRAQVPYAKRKWRADGFAPTLTWASPSRDDEMARAADELRGADVDLIVIDCMGHADEARRAMAERTGRLVIAAQSVVAKVAGAMI